MIEITIDEKSIRFKATPLTLLFYKQEFKSDLIGDLTKMENIKKDRSKFDSIQLLQIAWAMAKTDCFGEKFPGFEMWLSGFETIDFADETIFAALMEEAANGLFRKGLKKK